MRWIESIRLRSSDAEGLVKLAGELRRSVAEELGGELRDVRIYASAIVQADRSVHLVHETQTKKRPGTGVGDRLTIALDDHGLTDRSLWTKVSPDESHHR
jgi:hypothetical protein